MGGCWTIAIAVACLLGCSGPDIELGGGRLTTDEPAVGGGDGGVDAGGPQSSGAGSDASGASGDGDRNGNTDRFAPRDGVEPWSGGDDAGFEPPCDRNGPYCAQGGRVIFMDECEAWRAGEHDAWYCPRGNP